MQLQYVITAGEGTLVDHGEMTLGGFGEPDRLFTAYGRGRWKFARFDDDYKLLDKSTLGGKEAILIGYVDA